MLINVVVDYGRERETNPKLIKKEKRILNSELFPRRLNELDVKQTLPFLTDKIDSMRRGIKKVSYVFLVFKTKF